MWNGSPSFDQRGRLRWWVLQPGNERVVGVACRHHDPSRHLGAVGADHAADRVAFAREVGDLGVQHQRATGRLERPPQRLRHHAAAADRTTDPTDVADRIGQRTEPRARQLRRDAPHHRTRHHRRSAQGFRGEVVAHHICRAPSAPPQQRRRSATAAGDHLATDGRYRRWIVGIVEHHLHRGHRRFQVSAIAVDLGRVRARERVDGLLDVVVDRPRRPTVPRHVALRGIDVDVLQTVIGECEFVHDRRRPKRDVIAVADVDRAAGEHLARRSPTDRRPSLDQQRAQSRFRQVGRAHQTVVTGADHHGVVVPVGRGHLVILAH